MLTIDSSVSQSDIPGLYNCAVQNTRGSNSEGLVIPGNGKLIPYMMYQILFSTTKKINYTVTIFEWIPDVNWAMVVNKVCGHSYVMMTFNMYSFF